MDIKKFIKNTLAPQQESLRDKWVIDRLTAIPKGQTIIDIGAGEMPYKKFCYHLRYVSQDFGKYTGKNIKVGIPSGAFDSTKVDIVSDLTRIPVKDESFENILCTEVFEHIPNPFAALLEFNRINKKSGTLILSAPWSSLTHFHPFFYFSGFSENFYTKNFPKFGYTIKEMYVYGNYFNWLGLEFVRVPLVVFGYSRILALLLLPFVMLACPWYIFIRICGTLFPESKDTLAWGICVVAKKVKSVRKISTK